MPLPGHTRAPPGAPPPLQRTAMGEELSLPDAQPVVSRVLAGVTLAAAALYLDDLPMPQVGAAGGPEARGQTLARCAVAQGASGLRADAIGHAAHFCSQ